MAGEKIKIFELDIDVDAAIKAQSQLKDNLNSSKEALQELKEAGDTSSRQYVELEASVKNLSREYNAAQTQLGKMLTLQGKEIKTVKQGEAALTIINKEWAKQAQLFGTNSKEADALAKKHAELKEATNGLRKGIGDTSTNIGNYKNDMKGAIMETGIFQKSQAAVNSVLQVGTPVYKALRAEINAIKGNFDAATATTQGYTTAQKAAAVGTNVTAAALRVLKLALIATGIGAIIVLIGSLVAWFSKTQTGIDLVNKALAGMGAFFDVIIDRVAKVGGGLMKIISGDFAGGFEDITSAAKGLGDELQREINLAVRLEEVLQKVEKAEINLDIRRSAANSRLKELKLLTDDATKSTEERIAAAEEFVKIETSLTAEQVSNQEKRVAAMLGFAEVTDEVRDKIKQIGQEGVALEDLGISESTVEDMKAFRDEAAKLYDLQAQSYERQTENQNKMNSLRDQQKKKEEALAKERIANAQKVTEAAIKESQTRLQIFIEENQGKAKSLEDSIKFQEDIRDESLRILEAELKAGKKTRSEYELEVVKEKNEFLEKQKELTVQFANEELEIFKAQHQSRIDQNQMLTESIVSEEQKRLDLIAEKQREFEQKRLEQGEISQQDYNAAIDAINEENRIAKNEQAQALKEQQAEADAIDFENRMAIEEEKFLAKKELELERLNQLKAQELAQAEKTGADKTLIEQKFAEQQKQIAAEKEAFKTEVASQTFGNFAEILGKESAAGKAAAVAQTTIDTYKAAQSAYAAMAGIPVVGPALGIAAAGAAVASGLKSVQKIASTKKPNIPKAAKGITLQGKSHSQGGEKLFDESGNPIVEAEADENIYVLNKRASGLINSLSYINQATGGIPLSQATTYAAAGGMLQSFNSPTSFVNGNKPFDYELFAMKVAEANSQLPAPVLSLEEFNSRQAKSTRVINGANF